MKKIFIPLSILLLIFFLSLFGQKIASAADKDKITKKDFQILEVMFGILPNLDGKINSYALLKINYSPLMSSSISVYNKKHAKNKVDNEEWEETIEFLDRIDVNVKVIEFNFNIIKPDKKFGLVISPGINFDYFQEDKSKEYTSKWENADNATIKEMYIEKYRNTASSYMASIKTDFIFSFYKNYILTIGGTFLPVSYDINKLDEFSTSTEPDIDKFRDAYYEGNLDIDFLSLGYGVNSSISINNLFIGSFKLELSFLYKTGKSKNLDVWWDDVNLEKVSEKYKSEEERMTLSLNLYYYLDFLRAENITPILKIGWHRGIVYVDGEKDSLLSYDIIDIGIAFKL
ncbi:hypothetical protein ACFL20_03400 [Spirochaetota bacterium]